jgi:hypothetical protein
MKCLEFERVLPEYLEGNYLPEQQAHLQTCAACSNLLADLKLISEQAKSLIASHEPNPALWNALEERLRREGLIRQVEPSAFRLRPWPRRWRLAWLVPVAAAIAIGTVVKLHYPMKAGDTQPVAKQESVALPPAKPISSEDQQLLTTVAERPPAQRAKYRANLDDANSFIRDAEQSAKQYPSDIYMQQMLINAYEQKQMLYDLAVYRSEPGEQ